MKDIATIGLDTAKSVFQVHGVDAKGETVLRRQLKRRQVLAFFAKLPSCLVGIEACGASHYWSRELTKVGHTVRLIPPRYVKPYVKSQKNDATDAEAICEAVTRPNMRFVPTKTREQQSIVMLHRTRHLLVRQRTSTIFASALIEILKRPSLSLSKLPASLKRLTAKKSKGFQSADVPTSGPQRNFSLLPVENGQRRIALVNFAWLV